MAACGCYTPRPGVQVSSVLIGAAELHCRKDTHTPARCRKSKSNTLTLNSSLNPPLEIRSWKKQKQTRTKADRVFVNEIRRHSGWTSMSINSKTPKFHYGPEKASRWFRQFEGLLKAFSPTFPAPFDFTCRHEPYIPLVMLG